MTITLCKLGTKYKELGRSYMDKEKKNYNNMNARKEGSIKGLFKAVRNNN